MDALNPPMTVIIKLGSIARHTQEFLSLSGHEFDREAAEALLRDPEVQEWMADADKLALLPVPR